MSAKAISGSRGGDKKRLLTMDVNPEGQSELTVPDVVLVGTVADVYTSKNTGKIRDHRLGGIESTHGRS